MEERLVSYLKLMEETTKEENLEKEKDLSGLKQELLIQIGFFQHERLVHLIVTVTFALLAMLAILSTLFVQTIFLYILTILLMVLLIPYIRHYYILENGVQKLYQYYDKISKTHTK